MLHLILALGFLDRPRLVRFLCEVAPRCSTERDHLHFSWGKAPLDHGGFGCVCAARELFHHRPDEKPRHQLPIRVARFCSAAASTIESSHDSLLSGLQIVLSTLSRTSLTGAVRHWPAGVIAEAHYDGGRNFIAMLGGAKRYLLLPPSDCQKLYVPRQLATELAIAV